jgi:hypothetical protein
VPSLVAAATVRAFVRGPGGKPCLGAAGAMVDMRIS